MSKTRQREETAYALGKKAREKGLSKKENPYKSMLDEKRNLDHFWYRGWKHGK